MLQGPGENAGVIDLGEGEAVAFKVESHNHPSAVEPFQGAATGVGGILRDIVAMGARPVALLDGLRFGAPDWAFKRAVAGIGHYGNCVGVPTVGGEAVFDAAYAGNCLVNAMCVGLLPAERVTRARRAAPATSLVLYGATTGRDGIGGASVLASQELGEGAADKRPSVQVGDPFTGKKLIEVSLELVERGLVESLQDCGAAGLASSLAEMARDGAGVDVHLDRVPLREDGHGAVGDHDLREPGADGRGRPARAARRRSRRCSSAGSSTPRDRRGHGHRRAARVLRRRASSARSRPRSSRTSARATRSSSSPRRAAPAERPGNARAEGADLRAVRPARRLAHRAPARPRRRRAPAAPSFRGLAVSLEGRRWRARPFRAGGTAVLGAARNVACAGGEPIGLTDCLNFGNPEKPEIGWELAQAIEGIAAAAEALGVPVVSGNVSLYNETDGRAIPPTPVVGCVGLVPDVRERPARLARGRRACWRAPRATTSQPRRRCRASSGRRAPLLSLAHDVSDGGLEAALAEAAEWSGRERRVDVPKAPLGRRDRRRCAPERERLGWPRPAELGTVA